MNSKRRLTAIGATAAGLIGMTALTGAASASAATTSAPAPAPSSISAPAKPANPADREKRAVPAPADVKKAAHVKKAADASKAERAAEAKRAERASERRSDRAIARVKAAVLAKYPKATVNAITATDGGWTVSVTTAKGRTGTVAVDRDLNVGRLVFAQSGHHRS